MLPLPENEAPGRPGLAPRWTSSSKTGVGCALSGESRVWFTASHGILNEIYYPSLDQACTRDMGLIVTDGKDFFSEEKRDCDSRVSWLNDGVPAFRFANTCRTGRYRVEKEILADPHRPVIIQRVKFTPLSGKLGDYRLFALLAPHLDNQGANNTAFISSIEGRNWLLAQHNRTALAMVCSSGWSRCSVGYVGTSDGWQDLVRHKQMTWQYTRAENGNVALTGEIDLEECHGEFIIAIGFGESARNAADVAQRSLEAGFAAAQRVYVAEWRTWIDELAVPRAPSARPRDLSLISLAVQRMHESKASPGGIIASLSIPWGFSKGDNDLGGYHVVWPRDLVEAAGGLLSAGARAEAARVIEYLKRTQQADGHWAQNMWLDGSAYWNGIQMDETALPVLLTDLAVRTGALSAADESRLWPMVRQAAAYLVRNGPVSPQDRWEEDAGYSPFTIAAEIAALLVAADLAARQGEASISEYLRELADAWYSSIDRWMYVCDTDWSRAHKVNGYYVRIASGDSETDDGRPASVDIRNVAADESSRLVAHLISPDALALVRFGLRSATDARMSNTVTMIDALLKVNTPTGPTWHRYNDDGYGEKADGSPFDGTGIGRGWPLLTGERAHFELAAGRSDSALELLSAMGSFANEAGFLPEQVWDSEDVPQRELEAGRPSGSAMPLVWAHAEYLKLRRSLADGHVFDVPPQTVQRYLVEGTESPRMIWRFNHRMRALREGKMLRIETLAAARVHWSTDHWSTAQDSMTTDSCMGMHFVDLPLQRLLVAGSVIFTFYWLDATRWEGQDFEVLVAAKQEGPPRETRE